MSWPTSLVLTPLVLTPPVIVVGLLCVAAVLVIPARSSRHVAPTARRAGTGDQWGDPEADAGPTPDGHADPLARGGRIRRASRRLRPGGRVDAATASAGEVASAMALLAIAYRTGLPTWQVLTAVARTTADPVARDLRQVAAALQWGAGEAEAWTAVGMPWRAAARVVSLSHAGGVAPGPLLTTAADDLSRTEIDRLEIAVAQVGVRLVAPLGLVLLPAFCLTTVVPLVIALGRQLLVG